MRVCPDTAEQLAGALADAAARGPVQLGGRFSKNAAGGPVAPAETVVSTAAMRRVLAYDPRDLTVSVEAGLPWAELTNLLAENRQMLPLDPPFAASSTVGGVVAANLSGPRRRLYGSARDFIIGMKFATARGRLVESGGMVVKNVAGLDFAKLMVGSFGTLAAIAVVNFKVVPRPPETRLFLSVHDSAAEACAARHRILDSVLQPAALDLLNPAAAARLGLERYALCMAAGGSPAVLGRYAASGAGSQPAAASQAAPEFDALQEFTPAFLNDHPAGAVVRVSALPSDLAAILASTEAPLLARAASGVSYVHFDTVEAGVAWIESCPWKAVVEYAPPERKGSFDQWPRPSADLPLMRRVKTLFDPDGVLNPGRLYGRI